MTEHATPECPVCGSTKTRPLDGEWATCFECDEEWRLGWAVVNMRDEDDVGWREIADGLDLSVDQAMQLYRDWKYDHWDTGWTMDVSDGVARFETEIFTHWVDSPATVMLEEVTEKIPLSIELEGEHAEFVGNANLTPDQARELARTLDECADIAEENQ